MNYGLSKNSSSLAGAEAMSHMRVVRWRTRTGKWRVIRLYKSYKNMLDRIAGHNHAGNGATPWKGLENGFIDFQHFRTWALSNGYSKLNCSIDRIREDMGYSEANCQWVTRSQNTAYQNYRRGFNIRESRDSVIPF